MMHTTGESCVLVLHCHPIIAFGPDHEAESDFMFQLFYAEGIALMALKGKGAQHCYGYNCDPHACSFLHKLIIFISSTLTASAMPHVSI